MSETTGPPVFGGMEPIDISHVLGLLNAIRPPDGAVTGVRLFPSELAEKNMPVLMCHPEDYERLMRAVDAAGWKERDR